MSGDEIEATISDDGSVVKAASGGGGEQFRGGIGGICEVNSRGAGSFRDEDDGLVVLEELGVEIDGDSVGEAMFDGGGIDGNREDVEAVLEEVDGGEDDGAGGDVVHWGEVKEVAKVKSE